MLSPRIRRVAGDLLPGDVVTFAVPLEDLPAHWPFQIGWQSPRLAPTDTFAHPAFIVRRIVCVPASTPIAMVVVAKDAVPEDKAARSPGADAIDPLQRQMASYGDLPLFQREG